MSIRPWLLATACGWAVAAGAAPIALAFSGVISSAQTDNGAIAGAVGSAFSGQVTLDWSAATTQLTGPTYRVANSQSGCGGYVVNGSCNQFVHDGTPFVNYTINMLGSTYEGMSDALFQRNELRQEQDAGYSQWIARDDRQRFIRTGDSVGTVGTFSSSTHWQQFSLWVNAMVAMLADVTNLDEGVDTADLLQADQRRMSFLDASGTCTGVTTAYSSYCTSSTNRELRVTGELLSIGLVQPGVATELPEPGSLVLVAVAGAAACAGRRRTPRPHALTQST